jgi:hypothetical protein
MSAGFLPTIRGGLHIRTRHDAERDIVSNSNSGYLGTVLSRCPRLQPLTRHAEGGMSMPTAHDPTQLPSGLPAPEDDGAARHLTGMRLPVLALPATDGSNVDLSALTGRTVVYIYPRTGRPRQAPRTVGTQSPALGVARRSPVPFAIILLNFGALASLNCSVSPLRTPSTNARPLSACTCHFRCCPTQISSLPAALRCRPFRSEG